MKMTTPKYLRLGKQWAPVIGYRNSLDVVSRAMGIRSRQLTHYYACVALGKVIYRMREEMKLNKHKMHE